MSDRGKQIEPDSLELLLQILEMPKPVVTAAAIETLGARRAAPLIELGLLKPAGQERSSTSMSDHDDAPVSLSWSAEHGCYGYFSPTAGWITVSNDEIARYSVDVSASLARLMVNADVSARGGPTSLRPDLLWEVGDVRLGRRAQRVPVWFARRLYAPPVFQQLTNAVKARPSPQLRVILTSTSLRRLPAEALPGHLIVPVEDVIDHATGIGIHPQILAARLDGSRQPNVGSAIDLSPDGRRLTINGMVTIDFKTEIQIKLIRKLVGGHREGKRFSVQELLTEGGSGSASLPRAFGKKKWATLKPYLKSQNGLWAFEL